MEYEFIERILKVVDKWTNDLCVFCDPGTLVSKGGMEEYKCGKCGKAMNDNIYMGEISRLVFEYRNKFSKMG